MSYVFVCAVALLASGVTFFSGFGLGTVLVPAFAVFFAVEKAVALAAVVHVLNGVFKLALLWRHVDRRVAIRFGLPAMLAALAGAWLLLRLAQAPELFSYAAFGRSFAVTPVKLAIGVLLVVFAAAELVPAVRDVALPSRYLPLGGLLSGFFGGLSGMQGALRAAFLVKSGLSKESFVATSAAIAFFIDVSRLGVYSTMLSRPGTDIEAGLLAAAVAAAFAGSWLGNRYLAKVTLASIRVLVAALLFAVGAGLAAGLL